jgi:dsRNA-specific ribonuclease
MLNHKFIDCCTRLNYNFKDKGLLTQALTRKSAYIERPDLFPDYNEKFNRRLEFLGDAVLRCIISDLLIEKYPLCREGFLSKERDKLVSIDGLSIITEQLNLNQFISLGQGERKLLLNSNTNILPEVIKTVIGAIFIDCGRDYSRISKFIDGHFNILPLHHISEQKPYDFGIHQYKDFFKQLKYTFKDKGLFEKALTHASASNENGKPNNEVLEFLGDGVLRCVISDLLMEKHSKYDISQLNPERDKLVSNEINSMLHHIAEMLNLNEFISFGKGEVFNRAGRSKGLINAMEALIGAIFIDCGRDYSRISKFIDGHFNILQPVVPVPESRLTQVSPEGSRMISMYNNQQRQTKLKCFWVAAATVVAAAIILPCVSYAIQKPRL